LLDTRSLKRRFLGNTKQANAAARSGYERATLYLPNVRGRSPCAFILLFHRASRAQYFSPHR
jgi:hypothetical protein